MYHSQFVLSIKNSNKEILREYGGKCYLPFYSEYSLFLKNLRGFRSVVSIKIDGTDILGGSQLVVGANDSIDLERFISNGDLLKGNRFKFVPVEGNAQDPSSPDNGIIEVKVQWEVPFTITTATYIPPSGCIPWYSPYFYPTPSPTVKQYQPTPVNTFYCSGDREASLTNMSCSFSSTQNLVSHSVPTSKGVTVEGSKSNQAFNNVSTSWLAPEIVTLRLQLLAPEEKETFTVDSTSKKHCTECGKKIKGNFKFCPKCGTRQID